ncbi:polyketide cyclase [Marmoricola endophyticus]|uniref:Polyketide cyclase n=1 Tax=Marmoricola endophyticus TaxID=2040280 RepID=A0A917BRU2_9ACTN|nr:SRPBCC family protein [Marmoricola endophyticus]GGF55120.1 polyketide cyclase [Marmoricola endophyticus]
MAKAYYSAVIAAPVDEVWALVRGFNELPEWHPAIAGSEIVEGTDGQLGAVRRLALEGGGSVSEKLLAIDDVARSTTYCFTDPGPFPARSYVSTYRLAPVSATGGTFMEWYADFDAEAADEEKLAKTFGGGVFKGGIDALVERFG